MALTGLLLGGFLLVHTIGNATIFFGREAFNSYAHHLHSLGVLIPIFNIGLLAVFLLHVVTGVLLWLQNRSARGNQKYEVQANPGGITWGSQTMIYTGAAIFVFILIHLSNFTFVEKTEVNTIADIVGAKLGNPGFTLIYIVAMGVLALHISHGFWSLFQSFGISHPRYDCPIRIVAWAVAAVMIAVFVLVTLLLVVSQNHLLP